jgi:hypothetical protein
MTCYDYDYEYDITSNKKRRTEDQSAGIQEKILQSVQSIQLSCCFKMDHKRLTMEKDPFYFTFTDFTTDD